MQNNLSILEPQTSDLLSPGEFKTLPSSCPPNQLPASQVPQFITLAYDDNPDVQAMQWMMDLLKDKTNPIGTGQESTFDGTPVRTTFFSCGKYLDWNTALRKCHKEAYEQGHEIGNHSQNHMDGSEFTVDQWVDEISKCQSAFVRAGIPADAVRGFRIPYIDGNDAAYQALVKLGFVYDASVEEGVQIWMSGSDFNWPYTLDEGSPGRDELIVWRNNIPKPIGRHPGLWEIPNHFLMVPPDYLCEQYDCRWGLRERIRESILLNGGWDWKANFGKITAFDYNLWDLAELEPNEVLAIYKYTLDLRLSGNRAPMLFGAHVEHNPFTEPGKRAVLESFIDYALSKNAVRIVPAQKIVEWMKNPQPLKTAT